MTDYRNPSNSRRGESPTSDGAKGDAIKAINRIGRGLGGIGVTVTRPSGLGGWFCRAKPQGIGFDWEAWEKE